MILVIFLFNVIVMQGESRVGKWEITCSVDSNNCLQDRDDNSLFVLQVLS